jgi:hypothetical protein
MRNVAPRTMLLLVAMSALIAAAPPAAKQASAKTHAETTRLAHAYAARDWKRRHKASRVSRRRVRPLGHAGVYYRGGRPRLPNGYQTDLLLDCLFAQPFVICP